MALAVVLGTLVVAVLGALAALSPHASNLAGASEAEITDEIVLRPLALRSEMYDRNGDQITVLRGEENRERVALADIPETITTAILAVEDDTFYEHGGVNLRAMTRAAVKNLDDGGISQGGSTITQQLIKNAVLSSEQELDRKILEMRLAGQLESQMTKDEILEHYLNLVYFGNGAYGVKAASEVYFAKDVADIDWGEAALLAGLISAPSANDPITNPDGAKARRKVALNRLVAGGHLTREEAARHDRTSLPRSAQQIVPTIRDYFIEEVTQTLLDEPVLGATRRERINNVFGGGLRIYTTFDPLAQRLAEEARDDVLPETDRGFTMATTSIDPASGAVRSVIGGAGFDDYNYNVATQGLGRQPGSSFKTIVLVAALEQGLTGKDLLNGIGPCKFDNPGGIPASYEVENFDESRGGLRRVADQVSVSSNCGFIRLGQYVGLDAVVDVAQRLGITSELSDEIISLPLGTMEARPIELASAYATIANEGVYHQPYFIERIEDEDGKVLFEHRPVSHRAISRETARRTAEILMQNVDDGTGTAAQVNGHQAAGKTGTTQNFEDAWFVGFTRHLSTAVWMGHPEAKTPMRNVRGIDVTGGSYPAAMWGRYMQRYHNQADLEALDFVAPQPVKRPAKELLLPGESSLLPPPAPAIDPNARAQPRVSGQGPGRTPIINGAPFPATQPPGATPTPIARPVPTTIPTTVPTTIPTTIPTVPETVPPAIAETAPPPSPVEETPGARAEPRQPLS